MTDLATYIERFKERLELKAERQRWAMEQLDNTDFRTMTDRQAADRALARLIMLGRCE